ncbi:hypothetical protein C8Q79DRAFT_1104257 [Trametes meyenii]|nr:hypothetical protein C8Q79DRAFT_1104257 [Trametes meyenii]
MSVHRRMGFIYDFPLEFERRKILGTLQDGRQISFVDSDVRRVWPHTRELSVLSAAPEPNAEENLRDLLDQDMPVLRHLEIVRPLPDARHAVRSSPSFPTYDLLAHHFPLLVDLAISDCVVNVEIPIYSHLRFLHLEAYTDDVAHSLRLCEFLAILGNCSSLERIVVREYVDVDNVDPEGVPLLSLTGLRKLKQVTVVDDARVVSEILSHLIIPSYVDIHAVALARGDLHSAFRTMVPHYRYGRLLVLREATQIDVHDNGDHGCIISAFSPNRIGLSMELIDPDPVLLRLPNSHFNTALRRDGSLFSALVKTLDVFQQSPIRRLDFKGNFQKVGAPTWAVALDRFANVREISVEDNPSATGNGLDGFLRALCAPSDARQGLVASLLRKFEIKTAACDFSILETVRRCLGTREFHYAVPLAELQIELLLHGMEVSQRIVDDWERILSCHAEKVILRVLLPTNLQGRAIGEDQFRC